MKQIHEKYIWFFVSSFHQDSNMFGIFSLEIWKKTELMKLDEIW